MSSLNSDEWTAELALPLLLMLTCSRFLLAQKERKKGRKEGRKKSALQDCEDGRENTD